jgi:hypothetical protein
MVATPFWRGGTGAPEEAALVESLSGDAEDCGCAIEAIARPVVCSVFCAVKRLGSRSLD